MRVRHETCSTICGTPVQAILDQKNLTGSAGGAREGQNMAHLGHFNGKCAKMHYITNIIDVAKGFECGLLTVLEFKSLRVYFSSYDRNTNHPN